MVRIALGSLANGCRRLFELGGNLIASLSSNLARSSFKMPMLATFLFAIVFGTLVAGGMALVVPTLEQHKSSYAVMDAFFEKRRKAVKESELPVLLTLNTRKLAPSSVKHTVKVTGVSAGTLRIRVHYVRPKRNEQGPLELTLKEGADGTPNSSIVSASILPSEKPIRLEFQATAPQINLDLTRPSENRGVRWPRTRITVFQVTNE